MAIPIQNIYYLLSYAWEEFAPRQLEKIASEPFPDALHLFAAMLEAGVRSLHRRGFETGYVTFEEPTSSPRGRILMGQTIRLVAIQPGNVCCAYDELVPDVLTNQILKATLGQILETDGLNRSLRAKVHGAYRLLDQVSNIVLTPRVFLQVRLHQNNRFYSFLIHVCRFLFDSLQPLDQVGGYRFQDVLREPHGLRKIFEKFVYNFYRRNQRVFKSVRKEKTDWAGSALGGSDFGLVPQMETDVTLRDGERIIVIECKYTESVYQYNYFVKKLRSEHLYQLMAYLRNLGGGAEGILLYPTAGVAMDQSYLLQGHRVRVVTLDLNRGWSQIAESMLDLINPKTFPPALPIATIHQ
jgi:5-methylcytosine-specific restriction enzyme subunit McrC